MNFGGASPSPCSSPKSTTICSIMASCTRPASCGAVFCFRFEPVTERVREFKTWISEDAGPEATIDGLMSVIRYFNISSARAKEILSGVERAVATWRVKGRALGMTDTELDQFADAFEHAERAAARRAIQ